MSKKKANYSSKFKVKLVLELLKEEKTLSQIANDYNLSPGNLRNWKKAFIDNAEIAMEPSKVVREYKGQVTDLESQIDKYAMTLGKVTVERDWAVGKLKSLDLSIKREMIKVQAKITIESNLSISRQHELIGLSRSYIYSKPVVNSQKEEIKKRIISISEDDFMYIYGERKVYQQLVSEGYTVSLNTVSKYRKELGIKAIIAVKPISTTIADKAHPKYSYKLNDIVINRPNQVWSTDITYIKINGGMVYLAAIIDWDSKAVLSYKISNVMDTDFVMSVLNDALEKYPKPEIFNTDQGSQYTSYIHTQTLKDKGIIISMDSKGRATDNIVIERFWRSVKVERVYLNEYNSIKELKNDIKSYIDFYNYYRYHQSLEYKRPMEVYDNKKYIQVIENNKQNSFIESLQYVA